MPRLGYTIEDRHKGKDANRNRQRWRARVRNQGRYITESFDDYDEAVRWCEESKVDLRRGAVIDTAVTLKEAAGRYDLQLQADGATDKYRKDVQTICTRAMAAGVDRLDDRNLPKHVADYLASLKAKRQGQKTVQPASQRTRELHMSVLRAICALMVDEGRLIRNPLATARKRRNTKAGRGVVGKQRNVATVDQLRTILEQPAGNQWRLAAIMIYTGARLGSAVRLRWSDIQRGKITFRGEETGAKSGRDHVVDTPAELAELLKSKRFPVTGETVAGVDLEANHSQNFTAWLRRIGIEGITAHSLRHSFCCLLIATGLPTSEVQSRVGHSQISVTEGYTKQAKGFEADCRAWPRGEIQLLGMQAPKAQKPA